MSADGFGPPAWAPANDALSSEQAERVSQVLRDIVARTCKHLEVQSVRCQPGNDQSKRVFLVGMFSRERSDSDGHKVACTVMNPEGTLECIVFRLVADESEAQLVQQQEAEPDPAWQEVQGEASTLTMLQGTAAALAAGYVPVATGLLEQIGNALLAAKQPKAAQAMMGASLAKAPVNTSTMLMRSLLGELCEEIEDWDGALRAYLTVTTQCAHLLKPLTCDEPGLTRVTAFNNLGLAFKRSGKLDHAERTYRSALEGVEVECIHPDAQRVRWNLLNLLVSNEYLALCTQREAVDQRVADAVTALFGGESTVLCDGFGSEFSL